MIKPCQQLKKQLSSHPLSPKKKVAKAKWAKNCTQIKYRFRISKMGPMFSQWSGNRLWYYLLNLENPNVLRSHAKQFSGSIFYIQYLIYVKIHYDEIMHVVKNKFGVASITIYIVFEF